MDIKSDEKVNIKSNENSTPFTYSFDVKNIGLWTGGFC